MVTYTEYRNKFGKDEADKFASEQGFSESEIAKVSNEYESTEALLNPTGGISQEVANRYKKSKSLFAKMMDPFDLDDKYLDFAARGVADIRNSTMSKFLHLVTGTEFEPVPEGPNTTAGKIGGIIGSVIADSLIYTMGAITGGGQYSPVLAAGNAFGLHQFADSYLTQKLNNDKKRRQNLVEMYRNGTNTSLEDMIKTAVGQDNDYSMDYEQILKDTLKAEAVGATVGGANLVAGKLSDKVIGSRLFKSGTKNMSKNGKTLAEGVTSSTIGFTGEVGALGTAQPLSEGRIPTQNDFIDSALMIGTLKLTRAANTWDSYKKESQFREFKEKLATAKKEYELQKKVDSDTVGVTTRTERMALYSEAENAIEKTIKKEKGFTNRDLEDALQFVYITENMKPWEVVRNVTEDKTFNDAFMILADEIKDLGGLGNALRDKEFMERRYPQEEFKPVKSKEEPTEITENATDSDGKTKEIFVGARSGYFEEKRKEAERLINDGKLTRDEIRKQTGWDVQDVKTSDGESKRFYIFEIDDSQSKVTVNQADLKKGDRTTVGAIFDHPQLYEIYPWIKSMKVEFYDGREGSYGWTDPVGLSFGFNIKHSGPKELRDTLLHELQHIIQGYEEWGAGGSSRGFDASLPDAIKPFYEERQKLVPFLKKGLEDKGYNVQFVKDDSPMTLDVWRYEMEQIAAKDPVYADKFNRFMELLKETEPYESKLSFGRYLRLYGENQSRNVERRADFTPEQRREISPEMTQDFPNGTTIVRIGNKLYPKGDYNRNAMNRSTIYAYGDKMNLYVGTKERGTYEKADSLSKITAGLIADIYKNDTKSVFKEKIGKRKGIRGEYHPQEDYIRIRENNNISVISHELAHRIEERVVGDTFFPTSLRKELKAIATKGDILHEGFAEMFSYYLIDPDYVIKTTPNAYKYFENKMKNEFPETFAILNRYQKDIKAFREQPSEERLASLIAEDTLDKNTNLSFSQQFYTDYFDDLYPLKVFSDEVYSRMSESDKKLFNVNGASPYEASRRLRGISSKIKNFIEDKTFGVDGTIKGEGLKRILKGYSRDELRELNNYMLAKHAKEVFDAKLEEITLGLDYNDASEVIRKYEAKDEKGNYKYKHKATADKVYKYLDEVLQYAKEADIISEEVYEKLRKMYPAYIPLTRAVSKNNKGVGNLISEKLKKLRGSDLEVVNPISAIEQYTSNIIINADKNLILKKALFLANEDGGGAWLRVSPETMRVTKLAEDQMLLRRTNPQVRPDTVIVTPLMSNDMIWARLMGDKIYTPDGPQANEFKVLLGDNYKILTGDPEILATINGLYTISPNEGVFKKIAKLNTKMVRGGATARPSFIIKNYTRDQLTAYLNSEYGYMPFWDSMVGAVNILFKTEWVKEWERNGGSQASFKSTIGDNNYKKALKAYADEGWGTMLINTFTDPVEFTEAAYKTILSPYTVLSTLSEGLENSTRVGVYRRAKKGLLKEGYSNEVAGEKAAFEARDVTVDFARAGRLMRDANQYVAFLNASLQGNDKFIRTIMKDPVKRGLMLTGIAAGFILLEAINKDDKEIQRYNNAIHDTNIVLRTDDGVKKFPIPQELYPLKMAVRRFMQSQPFSVYDFAKDTFYDFVNTVTPNVIKTPLEPMANYSYFRRMPIVSSKTENLIGQYQVGPYTSSLSKLLAKSYTDASDRMTDNLSSPLVWDNILQNTTGSFVPSLINGVDKFISDKDDNPYREKTGVLNSSFLLIQNSSNTWVADKYYDIMEETYRVHNSKDLARKDGTRDERFKALDRFYMTHEKRKNLISKYMKFREKYLNKEINKKDTKAIQERNAKVYKYDNKIIELMEKIVNEYQKTFGE